MTGYDLLCKLSDNNAVMMPDGSVYRIPDGFEVPSEWEKSDDMGKWNLASHISLHGNEPILPVGIINNDRVKSNRKDPDYVIFGSQNGDASMRGRRELPDIDGILPDDLSLGMTC